MAGTLRKFSAPQESSEPPGAERGREVGLQCLQVRIQLKVLTAQGQAGAAVSMWNPGEL